MKVIIDSPWLMAFRRRLLDYRKAQLKGIHPSYHDRLIFDVQMSPEDYRDLGHNVSNHEAAELAIRGKFLMYNIREWRNETSSIGMNDIEREIPPEFEPLALEES